MTAGTYSITRIREYVAFFTIAVKTRKDGMFYGYFGCDALSELAFHTGMEPDEKPETVLRHISLLIAHPDFRKYGDEPFTLVLDRFGELAQSIEAILRASNGHVLYDAEFHRRIAKPFREGFAEITGGR